MTHPPVPPLSLDVLAFSHVPGWKLRGRCANAGNPDGMFPHERDRDGVRAAKAMCHACPVTADCLRFALENHEDHGVWGALSPEERRILARRQSRGDAA